MTYSIPGRLYKPHLLVVEDEIATIKGTILGLQRAGLRIDHAVTLKDAEEKLRGDAFDFVILDMRIPIETGGTIEPEGGRSLVESMQGGSLGERNRHVPFAIVTAQDRVVDVREFDKFGLCIGVYGKLMHNRMMREIGAAVAKGEEDRE